MLPINKKISLINWTDRNTKPTYIVIHYVGAVSTAKNNADYFYKTYRGASAHYFVDETSIWQVVEDNDSAWAVGGGKQSQKGASMYGVIKNSNSISIEMCVKKDKNGNWYYEEETLNNTRDLVLHLMNKYGIAAKNVYRHFDVTGKYCPANYLTDSTWKSLKSFLTTKPVEVESYSGYVQITYGGSDGIDIHSKPVFSGSVVKVAKKDEVFQVVGRIKVSGVYMYKLKDGNYITSVDKYVKYTKTDPTPKPTTDNAKTYKVVKTINGYMNAANAKNRKNAVSKVTAGTYHIFNEYQGMKNVSKTKGKAGSWINPSDNVATTTTISAIKVGDKVGVKAGVKDYNGNKANGVKRGVVCYRVDELKGKRAVLDKKGICTPFHVDNLFK